MPLVWHGCTCKWQWSLVLCVGVISLLCSINGIHRECTHCFSVWILEVPIGETLWRANDEQSDRGRPTLEWCLGAKSMQTWSREFGRGNIQGQITQCFLRCSIPISDSVHFGNVQMEKRGWNKIEREREMKTSDKLISMAKQFSARQTEMNERQRIHLNKLMPLPGRNGAEHLSQCQITNTHLSHCRLCRCKIS